MGGGTYGSPWEEEIDFVGGFESGEDESRRNTSVGGKDGGVEYWERWHSRKINMIEII